MKQELVFGESITRPQSGRLVSAARYSTGGVPRRVGDDSESLLMKARRRYLSLSPLVLIFAIHLVSVGEGGVAAGLRVYLCLVERFEISHHVT